MKFNEKLIELRKKAGLSQEELGYKLDVTRQTVSKWELGETTPEMAKLTEMSKIFNVSVDELINESEVTSNVNPIIEDQPIHNEKPKSNKALIVIVGLLIVVIIMIIVKAFSAFALLKTGNQAVEQASGLFDKIFSLFDKAIDSQLDAQGDAENIFGNATNKINISMFNGTFELYNGSNSGSQLKSLLDEVITSNKTEDKKITVKYLETETQDAEEIKNLKMSFKDSNNFEVTFDYDENGYINKVMIEQFFSEFEIKRFNNSFEMYGGTRWGSVVISVLDQIITNNKTEDRKITVKYQGTETLDETEIKNIKRNFGTFDNCEITFEYDADGFINKAIIEKL